MKIGFYGHSIASWINSPNNESFIDRIRLKYSADIVNVGVPQGSEERILFDLKKTKEVDVAIIFHSLIRYVFIPKSNRDLSIRTVPAKKSKILWTENNAKIPTQEDFDKEFFSYSNLKDVFGTAEEFCEAMTSHKEYFHHPDLLTNRFHGAMLLIDNYLLNKNIKAYHAITPNPAIFPPWLEIKSGVVDAELLPLSASMPIVGQKFSNNLDLAGNDFVFERLDKWLQCSSW